MTDINNNISKNNYIFNRIHKDISFYECLLIIRKQYFTDNFFYYFLCVLFRFLPLIILCGDYSIIFKERNNSKSIQQYLRILTFHNLLNNLNFSYNIYIIILFLILILFAIRI